MARSCSRGALAVFVGLVILHAASIAVADGKYFNRQTVAGEADPDMPFQRAIIAYRDGVETMVVESAVQGTGGDLGWVIPLPAEPTSITARTPGSLRSTYQLIGPRIEVRGGAGLQASVVVFVLILMICVAVVAENRQQRRRRGTRFVEATAVASLFLVLFMALLPALGSARRGVTAGVEVLQHEQVGSYDVSIVKGKAAAPVRQWLDDNGFSLPEAAVPVLAEYAGSGWCFAVSRIVTSEESVLSPHPLEFVFETPEAVYPMKLTGVGADEMQLDLYVIGEQAATAPHLERISCDTYRPSKGDWSSILGGRIRTSFEVAEGKQFKADHLKMRIGHPAVTKSMWPGCTLTHLRGELAAEDMAEDVVLGWESSESAHKTVYTPVAARAFGFTVAFRSGCVALLGLAILATLRTERPRGWLWLVRGLLACVIVCTAIGLATYCFVPKTTAGLQTPGEALPAHMADREQWRNYEAALSYVYVAAGKVTPNLVTFDQWWARQMPQRMPDWSYQTLDVPNWYTVERVGDDWLFTFYDRYATPALLRIAGTSRNGDSPSD